MTNKETANVIIRPKRQMTLPREFCRQLGIGPGDRLEMFVEAGRLVAMPKKTLALNAVREIRETFARYGITEKELQKTAREVRRHLVKEKYGKKA
jgi:bifunctional DNA-binding transcriptional regulator/antitoxin component of YhaV-PrlF toxin-antitoxin module